MSRQATGAIVERTGKRGRTYALRFRAYGARQYLTLGTAPEWDRGRAETELENVLADVRRALWRPPETIPTIEQPKEEPTLHEFASEWIVAREAEGLAAKTITDLRWSLSNHLLPHFASFKLSEITPQEVDRFKVAKAAEGKLSNNSINHVLSDLSQVLETAVEYGLISQNPASGKRRRLKSTRPNRPWIEPEQLGALLDGAKADDGLGVSRVLLGLLAGAGLRIGEALALRWQHVDLATGTLHVVGGKTAAATRSIDLGGSLREELVLWRAESRFTGPDDFVLTTSTGTKQNASNLRRDVLKPAIEAANKRLAKDGISPIGAVGFHGLRRTFASLRCACGDDIRYTSSQLGHEDPRFTLKCYAQATRRRERLSGPHLKAYDRAIEWARMGTNGDLERVPAMTRETENPAEAGLS